MSKAINRTDHLSNIRRIAGTNTGVVYDQTGKGVRQMLCPKCKASYVRPTRNGRGRLVYVCGCGASWSSSKM